MDRREFLATIASVALGASGCTGGDGDSTPTPSGPPNVVFLSLDDLNDWVGFLGGHPQVRTPNLDALAARSSTFRHAYCNAPMCGPSRASVLTGMYPHTTGIFDHSKITIPARFTSLPVDFANHGYNTRIIGKIYHYFVPLNYPLPGATPATNLVCSGAPTLPPHGLFDWAPLDIEDHETTDGQVTTDALEFLATQQSGTPFFLGIGYLRTHVPWYVPRKYFDLYPIGQIVVPDVPADDWDDLPPTAIALARSLNHHKCITDQGLWSSAVQGYLASISAVDAQVGTLLDYLDNSPFADNTIVVLWSDNGFHLGEKFHWHKQALWERSTHVPFLIRAPGPDIAPAMIGQNVGLIDLYPTLSELCGLPAVAGQEGRSLVPLMKNPARSWEYPVLSTYLKNHHAIRTSTWCYIRYENGEEELYDRIVDPDEIYNLAGNPAFAQVKQELGGYMPAPIA